MNATELTWINTLILIVVTLLELVVFYGISYQVRKTADAVSKVQDTAEKIVELLKA